jgi:hypothetical protein
MTMKERKRYKRQKRCIKNDLPALAAQRSLQRVLKNRSQKNNMRLDDFENFMH